MPFFRGKPQIVALWLPGSLSQVRTPAIGPSCSQAVGAELLRTSGHSRLEDRSQRPQHRNQPSAWSKHPEQQGGTSHKQGSCYQVEASCRPAFATLLFSQIPEAQQDSPLPTTSRDVRAANPKTQPYNFCLSIAVSNNPNPDSRLESISRETRLGSTVCVIA